MTQSPQPSSTRPRRRSFFRPATIRTRLLVGFVLMALLPAIGITAGSIILGYYNGRQQALRQLDSAAALKDLEIQSWIRSLQNELDLAANEQFAAERASIVLDQARKNRYYDFYLGAMRTRFQYYVSKSRQIEEIFLIDPDGLVVVSSNQPHEGQNFRITLPNIFARWGARMQMVYNAKPESVDAYLISPILTTDQQIQGYIVARASLSPLAVILNRSTGLGDTGKSYLAVSGNTLLVAPRGDTGRLNYRDAGSLAIQSDLNSHTGGAGVYLDYRGVEVAGVYRWQPDLSLMLVTEQDLAEAFDPVYSVLKVSLGIALLAMLLAAGVSLIITRGIARPIVELVQTTTQIAAGDLNQTVPVDRSDEVGALGVAFNSMTAQLRGLVDGLEKRVETRTHELQEANQALENKAMQLETIAKISREAASILDLDRLLATVVSLICEAFGALRVLVFLVDPDGRTLSLRAWSSGPDLSAKIIPINRNSLNGAAVLEGRTVLVDDTSRDSRFLPESTMPEVSSELVIPLRAGERVLGTLDVLSAQPAAFTPEAARVIQSLGDHVAVAIQNAWLYDRSRDLAVMEERNRLARELHDSVTQSLYSLWLLAEGWRRLASTGRLAASEEQLAQVSGIAQQALKEMRLLVYELRPAALEQEGLLAALHRRMDAVEKRSGVQARLVADNLVELPGRLEEALYWIAQEALNNALKHANATSVTLRLSSTPDEVVLEVSDDGSGFDPLAAGQNGGMGLASMRERAIRLGGTLDIQSAPGQGTTIFARLPIPEGQRENIYSVP